MVDSVTPAQRSNIMSRVRSANTRPEMIIRRMLHKAGFRYRLHVASLPGRKKVIFVHGCFWHMHEGCRRGALPKSRTDFWTTKLILNRQKDHKNSALLNEPGWKVITVWECELNDPKLLSKNKEFSFVSGPRTLLTVICLLFIHLRFP
jgi:DNA mismatch endonuclease (patch repair protein)